MIPFRVIVADPPWAPADSLGKRGAAANYNVMRFEDICMLQLPPIADDAILFLWRLASMQEEAFAVAHMWGFDVKTEIVWAKRNKQLLVDEEDWTEDDLAFGMGRSVRGAHETCLICTRGKYTKLIKNHSIRSVFTAPIGKHSEKPDKFFDIVESLVDGEGPFLELFSRRQRAGWHCIGDALGTKLNPCHSQGDHSGSTGASSAGPRDDGSP